jgi:hypothetical protein
MMTPSQAIKIAASRVYIVQQGRGEYVLHTWSTDHQAWWVSHPRDRSSVFAAAWEAKVREALELLGWDRIEAGAEANVALDGCSVGREDWRTAVRRLAPNGVLEKIAAARSVEDLHALLYRCETAEQHAALCQREAELVAATGRR